MGDLINDLPNDDLPATSEEKEMMKWMFKIKENIAGPKFFLEIKSFFFIVILYIVLSNTYTDSIFQKIIPITKSGIFLLILKSIVFATILYLFFNYKSS
jgi:hypothetical protein